MEIRSIIGDVILAVVMVGATLVLVLRLWQDLVISVAATLMMVSLAGLFLSMGRKIDRLDSSFAQRERSIRMNLDEIHTGMSKKYDATMEHVNGVVQELSRRMYR
ncbi:MAG: hypothetical protein LUQ64_02020 [Methanomicrobiales archaeon]|nr:hypothetical protein [Methanomicrobiales archaeon]